MEQTTTIWPSGRDPRTVVHPDPPMAWLRRWAARSARQARAIAYEAAQGWRAWPHADAGLLASLLILLGPAFIPPQAVQGEPAQAYVNFIVQAVIMIIAIIVAVALAPKPPQPKPNALADFDAPTAEEGKPYCKVFGEAVIRDPNVIWYGDLSSEAIRKKGGKK
jgi:hypothetical protein